MLDATFPRHFSIDLDKYTRNSYLTHNYHPYPAKFIPQIPKSLILEFSTAKDWILDPFCGSGTTLVEAKLNNRNSVGIDINPIACLSSQVKSTNLSERQLAFILEKGAEIEDDIALGKVYEIPVFHNIDLWFKKRVQEELSVVRHHVNQLTDEETRRFLQLAFSSIIVKVSNQDSDTRYKSIDKPFQKNDTGKFLKSKILDMVGRMRQFNNLVSDCQTLVYHQDSTSKDISIPQEISLAVTSPPYLNSYDYYLYHKHRMHWLSIDYRDVQEREFGSRNKHNDKSIGIGAYKEAIQTNAVSVKKVLKRGGYYCVVVGDGILKGQIIRMNSFFDEIFMEIGYQKTHEVVFDQRKYTKTFTPNLQSVHKNTYILIYLNP